jgi:hypothetical protein
MQVMILSRVLVKTTQHHPKFRTTTFMVLLNLGTVASSIVGRRFSLKLGVHA